MFCCSSHEQAEWRTAAAAAAAGVGAAASPADADPDYPLVALSFSGLATQACHISTPHVEKNDTCCTVATRSQTDYSSLENTLFSERCCCCCCCFINKSLRPFISELMKFNSTYAVIWLINVPNTKEQETRTFRASQQNSITKQNGTKQNLVWRELRWNKKFASLRPKIFLTWWERKKIAGGESRRALRLLRHRRQSLLIPAEDLSRVKRSRSGC